MTITSTIRHNPLSAETTEWFFHLLHLLDTKNLDEYLTHLSPDVVISFHSSHPPTTLRGLDDVRQGLSIFWAQFDTIEHEELNVYGDDRRFVHEAWNHYCTLDARRVTVRAVAFIDRDDRGRIEELRIYGDQSEVWRKTSTDDG